MKFRTNWRHEGHDGVCALRPLIGGSEVCMLTPAAATDAIEVSFAGKAGSGEETPRPPSSGIRTAIVPPASATSLSTFAGSVPESNATVYIDVAPVPPTAPVDAVAPVTTRSAAETAASA